MSALVFELGNEHSNDFGFRGSDALYHVLKILPFSSRWLSFGFRQSKPHNNNVCMLPWTQLVVFIGWNEEDIFNYSRNELSIFIGYRNVVRLQHF